MAEEDRPLLGELKGEILALVSDLREMFVLRWQLARLELRTDLRSIGRLAFVLLAAAVSVLTALPLLAVCLADLLDGVIFVRDGWLLIFALGLLIFAGLGGWLSWRRFRRRFLGLEQTLEELREDAIWLREWTGRDQP